MIIDIFDASKKNLLHTFEVNLNDTILNIKEQIHKTNRKLYPGRQRLRLGGKNENLNDSDTLEKANITAHHNKLYLKDLGPQIGWNTVFLTEYFGPLVIYSIFYLRPTFIYGAEASNPMPMIMHLSCLCYNIHFAKRLFETLFIHRFSHSTMPLSNLFKNCGYYWMFAAFIAYFNNHPLYTVPSFGMLQIGIGFLGFALSEIGNFSIHVAFMKMRPAGSKKREIPKPNSNPFTSLFNFVSCPNYTYEVYAWLFYSIMTQSLPALLFTAAGFYQMAVWAIGKHKAYRKEFPKYPKGRRAIIPLLL